jgi:hypothetical protein
MIYRNKMQGRVNEKDSRDIKRRDSVESVAVAHFLAPLEIIQRSDNKNSIHNDSVVDSDVIKYIKRN